MDETTTFELLKNSGLKVFGMDSDFIYFEDPSCILPAFDTLLEYAWVAILIMLAIMLFGWGVLYIKNGVKIDTLFNNAKTIILILGILGAVKPVVTIIYGKDLFAQQCEVKQVSRAAVNELLEMRNKKLGKSDENLLYENFNVIDSGPTSMGTENISTEDITPSFVGKNIETDSKKNIETISSESTGTTLTKNISGLPVSIDASSRRLEIIYVYSDGTKIKKSGGNRAWRNNNPGNITKKIYGAIGIVDGFAIYPDEEAGLRASMQLLRNDRRYKNTPLGKVYEKWAPREAGNDPVAYANFVSKKTDIPLNKRISELSDNELMRVVRAMQIKEGYKSGEVEILQKGTKNEQN